MNESKYPKSLSILLALNLCALLVTLIISMEGIWEGVHVVMGIQVIVLALGLILIVLPKAKGKRRGMLGILGMAIAAPVIILFCGHLFAEAANMDRTEQRVFTLLSFYAAAVPLLMLGVVVVHEGWDANPNSVRRQCFLYLCFLLGVAGVVVNDTDVGLPALFAIVFAMIAQSLLLLCLPIMKGCRLRLIGMGIVTIIGPIPISMLAIRIAQEQFSMRRSDAGELGFLILFAAAIVLSLLALFRLRHGWIAEEAKRRVGWPGNIVLALNLFAPIGLYALALGLTDGGRRDEGLLMLVPGWLFFAGLALMALGRGMAALQPIKPLRGSGEMSFLIGAAMLSVAFLIGETRGNERSLFASVGFLLLGILALHHVVRGFVSRWVRDSVQRFLFKWTVRGVPALIVLAIVGVSAFYAVGKTMAKSALAEYKAASETEGWSYDINDYIGEVPADDENFFMAKPFSGFLYTMKVGEKAVYLNPTIKTNVEAVIGRRVTPRRRISEKPSGATVTKIVHPGDFADQLRVGEGPSGYGLSRSKAIAPMEGTDQEVIDQYFAKFDGLISDLREAAKRPKQNFPYPFENGQNVLLPHLAKFKGITQLLQHSAAIKLARGDADRAMEDVRLQFRLFEATGGDIYLIGQLVHAAIAHIIVDGLTAGLHMGQWSDEQLVEWDKLLTLERDYLKQWDRCMQGERLSTGLTIESAINGVDLGDGWDFAKDTKMIPKQWLVKDLIFFDTTLKKYIELIRQAKDTGRIDQNKISLHFSEAAKTSKQKLYPFSRMFLPALNKALNKTGRMMNSFSAARLGIAIERYRRAKGDLPGDLSDLVPDYIGALPKDALTGKPLAWEHHGSPRYKIPVSDTDSQSWKYDGILAAIQAGDLGRLKAFAEKGWKITRSEGGSTQPPESNPNMAGMMPYGMMGPGMLGGSKTIDFSASETEILTQQNALHHAVHSGNLELLQWLIEQGLDPNASASVWTPEKSNASMPGMMPGMMMPYGMGMYGGMGMGNSTQSVLEFATNERQTEMVKALRDAGASPVKKKTRRQQGNPLGMGMMPGMMPPGMGMNPFGMGMDPFGMESDPEEEIKAINERLAKGQSLNRYNQWGQTELMIAVEAEDIDLAKRLLENKAYPNATSKDGELNTALHLAAMQENKAMCELLLDKGARVNKKNKIGLTPLDAALYANEMLSLGGAPPEPSEAGQATVAFLKSKGGTSMTPEERAEADPGMGGGMMPPPGMFGFPGGMPPNMFGPNPFLPPGGNPYATPKGRNPTPSKRQ